MFIVRTALFGLLSGALVMPAHALIVSRTHTVTARYSHFENRSGTPIETVLAEQVRMFGGVGQATSTIEAPMPAFFDVDYIGSAFAKASARVINVGGDGNLVITNAYVTGQGVSTPAAPHTPFMTSLVEDVAVGVAPVGDGVRVLYSFDLKNLSAEIWDRRLTVDPTGRASVELQYTVEFNGELKYQTFAGVIGNKDGLSMLFAGMDGVDFQGNPISGTLDVRSETAGPGGLPQVIEFEGKSVRFLDLGIATGGEGYEVKATMMARLSLPEFNYEIGGRSNIGDPNDISGVGLGQITLAPVPELSMAWLLLGGLGTLAFFARRTRTMAPSAA